MFFNTFNPFIFLQAQNMYKISISTFWTTRNSTDIATSMNLFSYNKDYTLTRHEIKKSKYYNCVTELWETFKSFKKTLTIQENIKKLTFGFQVKNVIFSGWNLKKLLWIITPTEANITYCYDITHELDLPAKPTWFAQQTYTTTLRITNTL